MAGKRTNGEGTISKRKNGTYEGAAYVLMAGSGQKRIHVYGKTVQEVQEKLTAAKMQSINGIPVADRSWTLTEYIDYWLKDVVQSNRRPSTRQNYVWVAERFLKPGLGSYRLERLSVAIVQKWLDEASMDGASRHRVRLLRTVLSTVLTRAQREELIQRNVAQLVELPRYKPKKRAPWSIQEARYFLQAVADDENYPLYLLLVLYGLRRGEVLGLRWGDVDFEQGVIHIQNNLQRLGGQFVQGLVKTDAGERDLPMLANVRQVLLNLRAAPLATERDVSDEALIFVTQLGTPRDPDGFSKGFKRAAKRNGLRDIRMHDLRHTAATMLKDLGVPPKDAQVILGHADIATTLEIYTHSNLETSETALTKVETALLPSKIQNQDNEKLDGDGRCRTVVVNEGRSDGEIGVFGALLTPVNKWCPAQESNLQPLVPEVEFWSARGRVNGVRRVADVWKRQWLVGAVVVSVVVSSEQFLLGELANGLLFVPDGLKGFGQSLGRSGLHGSYLVLAR